MIQTAYLENKFRSEFLEKNLVEYVERYLIKIDWVISTLKLKIWCEIERENKLISFWYLCLHLGNEWIFRR